MAEQHGGGAHLRKTLRWHHGFVLALATAAGAFITMGYTIGAIGAAAAVAVWALVTVVAVAQNFLFAEMAAMFPDKPGGIALYAHEAWRRHFAPLGPLAAFGYWMGWSLVLAIVGVIIGSLVQAQWFPHATFTVWSGSVHLGLPAFIGAGTVIACWVLNILGIKVAVRVNQAIGVVFVAVLAIIMFGPYLAGGWHPANLGWHVSGPWHGVKAFIVWLYVSAWAGYGSELCAAFAPEYRDTTRDTHRALFSTGLFMVAIYTLVPIGAAGSIGEHAIANNPLTYGVLTTKHVLGGASGIVTAVVCAAFFLSMVSSSADAARALYGIARDDMTIKQLDHLNRFGVPSRALTIDLIANVAIIAFVGSPLGILFASNLGYILAIVLAVSGFLLLRRDRPAWPRPIRLSRAWLPAAGVIAVFNVVLLIVGGSSPRLSGYGGIKEVIIGLALLSVGLVLFLYRRLVQDRGPLRLREFAPAVPDQRPVMAEPAPRQAAETATTAAR
jgi:amino acid transporter